MKRKPWRVFYTRAIYGPHLVSHTQTHGHDITNVESCSRGSCKIQSFAVEYYAVVVGGPRLHCLSVKYPAIPTLQTTSSFEALRVMGACLSCLGLSSNDGNDVSRVVSKYPSFRTATYPLLRPSIPSFYIETTLTISTQEITTAPPYPVLKDSTA